MQALQLETTLEPNTAHRVDLDVERITEFAQQNLSVDDAVFIDVTGADAQRETSTAECRLANLVVQGDVLIAVPDMIFEQEAFHSAVCGFLGVPIHDADGKPFAALCVTTRKTRVWSRKDREMLLFLARELEEVTRMRETLAAEARRAAQHRLIAQEYHHRIRNAFSVSSAVVVLTGAQCPSVQSLVETTSGQLAALADAHTAIGFEEEAADLSLLIAGAVQPHTFSDATIEVDGQDVEIPQDKVVSVSLILNELATNSTKYGAFRLGGRLRINWTVEEGQVCLRWSERSSTPRTTRTDRGGSFGGVMMDLSVTQLGATLDRIWLRDGLEVKLSFPA